ncbi:MAG TPA: PAS domain S-box protein, partial [Gemmatimonadales bacterium]|nr:PAS domain S-box protein [Gemmatimonadales bacterium]
MTRPGTPERLAFDRDTLLYMAAAVEAMQLGVTITDTQGRIVFVNPADAALHGYEVSELLGRDAHIFAPSVRRKRPSGEQLRDFSRWVRETVNVRKDGSTFPVRLLSDVIRSPDGEPAGIVTTCEDLTERRVLEDELRHSQKMEALGQLTGGIAHDFNNLLTVILSSLDLMLAGVPADADDVRADIAEIRAAAHRGTSLVRKLLAFSRKERISLQSVDLGAFVTEQKEILRRLLPESIRVQVTGEPGLVPASVVLDGRLVDADAQPLPILHVLFLDLVATALAQHLEVVGTVFFGKL